MNYLKNMRHSLQDLVEKLNLSQGLRHPEEMVKWEADLRKRFWSKVIIKSDSECWVWTSATATNYGYFRVKNSCVTAHKMSFWLSKGPTGFLFVLHSCDNRICCNPNHLFLGTQSDNIQDAIKKGRLTLGSRSHLSKLNESDIHKILTLKGKISTKNIASLFKVSTATITRIINRKIWKHVPYPAILCVPKP